MGHWIEYERGQQIACILIHAYPRAGALGLELEEVRAFRALGTS